MDKKILYLAIVIIIIVVAAVFVMRYPSGLDNVPEYPVKVSGLENFLAGISQVIKFSPAKRVEVSIADQKLKMFEADKLVNELSVSTGAPGSPTPTGNFKILNKFVMVNSKKLGCWLPFWAGFTKDGLYGFHEVPICAQGRVGSDLMGTPASHGCVRLSVQDGETFYKWIEVGATVVIKK